MDIVFIKNTAISLGICYLLMSPVVAAPVHSYLIFFPDKRIHNVYSLKEIRGVPKVDVQIESGKKKIDAWLFENKGADKIVLVSHGNAGNLAHRAVIADALIESGLSVLLYDYQGYGKSEGSPSVKNVCQDGVAAYDYLIAKGYKAENIILYGESLGCAVATNVSSQRKCAGLILQSGFSSLRNIACEKYLLFNAYPNFLFPKPNLDSLAVLKKAHPPLLIMHGKEDHTIPCTHAEKMYNTAVGKKSIVLFEGAGHNDVFDTSRGQFLTAVKQFVAELPSSPQVVPPAQPAEVQKATLVPVEH